jgi:hypothetical protein
MSSNLSSPEHPRSLPPIPPPPRSMENKCVGPLELLQAMLFGVLGTCAVIATAIALCVAFHLRNQYDALLIEVRTHIATHQKN